MKYNKENNKELNVQRKEDLRRKIKNGGKQLEEKEKRLERLNK